MARRAAATAAQLETATAKKIVSKLADQSAKPVEQFHVRQISVSEVTAPPMSGWLKVTSIKTGYTVFVPLPIRLIHQIPDEKGGGCVVRGAHGDEATATESIVQILMALNGYPVNGDVSTWSLAG